MKLSLLVTLSIFLVLAVQIVEGRGKGGNIVRYIDKEIDRLLTVNISYFLNISSVITLD